MDEAKQARPLGADELVVIVPKGLADKVRVEEVEAEAAASQITVRVSRERVSMKIPTLGIIVK